MENNYVIKASSLGKRYRLGNTIDLQRTFRETIMTWPGHLAKKFKPSQKKGLSNENPKKNNDQEANDFFWAVQDINFEIKQGEIVGIIGRNGAGKSTLLKILSRITAPTTGHARIKGRIGSLLEVGTGFHPELTGRENIYLNGVIIGMSKAEVKKKFDEIIAFSEVEKFIDTPVKRYSSGMRVRLAFAVAAHLEPEILLVDEVLAVGDLAFQKKCLGKMGNVAKTGHTILFVSHNMGAIRNLCTRCIYLDHGRTVNDGETESIIDEYINNTVNEASNNIPFPVEAGNGTCIPVSLKFFSMEGEQKNLFRLKEKWKIVLEFEMFKAAKDVVAAVGMITFDSIPLLTYWSKPCDLEPGKYTVCFECDIPFRSLDIRFAVGLTSNSYNIYYVSGIDHLKISNVAIGTQPIMGTSSKSGILLTESNSAISSLVE
jgi:lipopolysaccharide transport system ATP-binding protein